MQTINSAIPENLRQYARGARAACAHLEEETRRLEAALGYFHANCTEYRVVVTYGLDARLSAAARDLGELAMWVDSTAAAYSTADAADSGGFNPNTMVPLWVTPAAPPPADELPVQTPAQPSAAAQAEAARIALTLYKAVAELRSGRPVAAVKTIFRLDVPRAVGSAARPTLVAVEVFGTGAVAHAAGVLNNTLNQTLAVLGTAREYGVDAAALLVFQKLWVMDPRFPGGDLVFGEFGRPLAFNGFAAVLLGHLGLLEAGARTGPFAGPVIASLSPIIGPGLIVCGLGIGGLSVVSDAPHWTFQPVTEPGDLLDLLERSFWNQSFENIDKHLRLELGRRMDALNLLLNGNNEEMAAPQPPPPPANSVHGAYAAISYNAGEQVVLERLNAEGDYRLSIAGLDPSKPGAPNNFTAVMLTADFPPELNHYYHHVRARFLAALEQIPPGSRLHIQGHSMGGGVSLLLREDPEIQRRLDAAQITVPSLTIYGAVVPVHAQLKPSFSDGGAFANSEFRAYVHRSDSLAQNVGSGYEDYAEVHMIGGPLVEAPQHAHGDYANPVNYRDLPPELTELPYIIDPTSYERTIPTAPVAPLEEPPVIIAYP